MSQTTSAGNTQSQNFQSYSFFSLLPLRWIDKQMERQKDDKEVIPMCQPTYAATTASTMFNHIIVSSAVFTNMHMICLT